MKLDLGKYADIYEKQVTDGINDATIILLSEVLQKSPVDTGEYIRGNKRTQAKKEGNKIVGEVYNDSDYGLEVELGFKRSEVNWHKNRKAGGPVIYRGVGARVYTRTYDEKEKEILGILKNTIG